MLEQRTKQSIELRNRLSATRRELDAQRARKTDLLTSLVERKELNAAYLDELAQAEARLQQLLGGLAEGDVAVPDGRLPRQPALAGRGPGARRLRPAQAPAVRHLHRAQRRRDRGRARDPGPRRARGPGGVRRPLPGLRADGRDRPRRQAPLALRPAAGRGRRARARTSRPGRSSARRARARTRARPSTSRCASRAGRRTRSTGSGGPDPRAAGPERAAAVGAILPGP